MILLLLWNIPAFVRLIARRSCAPEPRPHSFRRQWFCQGLAVCAVLARQSGVSFWPRVHARRRRRATPRSTRTSRIALATRIQKRAFSSRVWSSSSTLCNIPNSLAVLRNCGGVVSSSGLGLKFRKPVFPGARSKSRRNAYNSGFRGALTQTAGDFAVFGFALPFVPRAVFVRHTQWFGALMYLSGSSSVSCLALLTLKYAVSLVSGTSFLQFHDCSFLPGENVVCCSFGRCTGSRFTAGVRSTPGGFWSYHVAGIQEFREFVDHFHASAVWTFIRVFVQVCHGFDWRADSHVQVVFEFLEESWIVWGSPSVVSYADSVHDSLTVDEFSSAVAWVAAFAPCCFFLKFLGVVLGAHTVIHAWAR